MPEHIRYRVDDGKSQTLQCTIEGCVAMTSGTWMRNDNIATNIKETRSEWNDKTHVLTSYLTIKCARTSDSGLYNYSILDITSSDIKLKVIKSKFYTVPAILCFIYLNIVSS